MRTARGVLVALAMCAVAAVARPVAAQLPGATVRSTAWPIRSREHLDLWLHGFAMISNDSSPVPMFRVGYRETLTAARTKAGVVTDLDVNHDMLAKRLRENPALVNAQFLALPFITWGEFAATIDAFAKADGNPKKAKTREEGVFFGVFAKVFPAKADREFARVLANSLTNESALFFHSWWVNEMRRRENTLAAIDSVWHRAMYPKLQGYLNHSQQPSGDLILSVTLEGEGRTGSDVRDRPQVAVGYPDSPDHAMDAIYAFVHEIVGPLTGPAVDDNTTPAEKRSGIATTLSSFALVRGGELLLARVSPELAAGYARFYLHIAGVTFDGDPMPAFARAFPIPKAMIDSIERQISIALGGI
jgi:hypothetical protein